MSVGVVRGKLLNDMSEEEVDTRKLAIFPLLFQAAYNGYVALKMIREGNGDVLDGGSPYESEKDLSLVVKALMNIGIKPRFRAGYNEEMGRTLKHFYGYERDRICEMFSPDIAERDSTLETLRKEADDAKRSIAVIRSHLADVNIKQKEHKWFLEHVPEIRKLLRVICESYDDLIVRLNLLSQVKITDDDRKKEAANMTESLDEIRRTAAGLRENLLESVPGITKINIRDAMAVDARIGSDKGVCGDGIG